MYMLNSSRPSLIASTDMTLHGDQESTWLWIDGHRIPYYTEFDVGGSFYHKISEAMELIESDRNGYYLFKVPLQWYLVDTNHGCMMHAGATAAAFNIAGTAAVMSLLQVFQKHKSGEMVIDYLCRTRQYGNIAEVEARVVKFGTKVAVTNIKVTDQQSKEVLARGVLSTCLGKVKPPPPVYRRNIQPHPWRFRKTFKTFEQSRGISITDVDMWDLSGGHLATDQKYLPVEARSKNLLAKTGERQHVCPACESVVGDRKEISKLEKLGIARPSLVSFQLGEIAKKAAKHCPVVKAMQTIQLRKQLWTLRPEDFDLPISPLPPEPAPVFANDPTHIRLPFLKRYSM
ncbi:hypothetical protein MPTK1_8g06000 [Marchantia polymorpha subsp. ruderalis]|uniref:Thioesterase domain-containing protein n=2 Tax=Marchantia polymorpha TaxID=3197 RepID=A0A176VYU9_MARPO|nr:hypothetical protein AXG93_3444s1080 [Marchantia polymorpha subsp. ruderalis]PTQ45996.1 hypothetical protein MARPO_0013s0190 [Marchantia polymorpha]BBN18848.1 hypothetical protein Mp_8g06000 [Marchantia polymorpha subsp. ruderalis]|eukprot:PTQ45996.1 hypothetical protein MARPO_0013s0190 [Marchantia polymorpha]